jgi:competence protein ComEA
MEQAAGTRERTTARSRDDTSPGRRGGGRRVPVAPSPFAKGTRLGARLAWFRELTESVWAPIALKALGILAGMLALAGIGASSLSRTAGVPASAGSGAPGSALAAGLGVLSKVEPGRGHTGAAASAAPPVPSGVAPGASSAPGTDAGAPPSGVTADGKVILNRASVDEMGLLPGVGPKRAQALVDLRTKLGGRFKRMADLLRLKGIGPKGLRKIEAKAVLDAP